MIIKSLIAIFSIAALTIQAQEAHVFWHLAQTNGYALTETPGPGLPAGATIHEGMVTTATIAVGLGFAESGFNVGSAVGDDQGWNAVYYSGDLNGATMTGTADSAFIRGEIRDGFWGDAFNQAGPIALRVGVVDVSFGITMWGSPEGLPADAVWADLDPMNSLAYDMTLIAGTETTVNITGEAGRATASSSSSLDKQFKSINVTPQVNYILANTGQFAIVCLAPMGAGSTGKMNLYATETCDFTLEVVSGDHATGSDNAWTTDGNTVHLLAYGSLTAAEKVAPTAVSGLSLKQNAPNPFNPSTTIAYTTGTKPGNISIFNTAGKMVHAASVTGTGSLVWDAGKNPSGVYVCRLQAGTKTSSIKMFLLK